LPRAMTRGSLLTEGIALGSNPEETMKVTRLAALLAALGLLAVTSARAADAKAMGNVTLSEKPLAEGKVTFHLANDQFIGSKIKDGKYLIDRLPTSKHRVTIEGKGAAEVRVGGNDDADY
jgi:hypothetical protein